MEILIFLIPFIIFLYMLYKISKDDHVLLRRGIKLVEIFDIAFISLIVTIFILIILPGENSYTPVLFIAPAILLLIMFARKKKLSAGRLLDLFSLSFLTSFPLWLVLVGLFAKFYIWQYYLILSVIFLLIDIVFLIKLLPKILNRSIPDGLLSIYFILLFSVIYLIFKIFVSLISKNSIINLDTAILILYILIGVYILVAKRRS